MGGRGTIVGKEGAPTCPSVAAARTQSTWTPLQLPVQGPGPVWPAEEPSEKPVHTIAESIREWAGGTQGLEHASLSWCRV